MESFEKSYASLHLLQVLRPQGLPSGSLVPKYILALVEDTDRSLVSFLFLLQLLVNSNGDCRQDPEVIEIVFDGSCGSIVV